MKGLIFRNLLTTVTKNVIISYKLKEIEKEIIMKIIYTDCNETTVVEVSTIKEAVTEIIKTTSWMKEENVDWEEFKSDLEKVEEIGLLERTVDQYINKHWEGSVSIEIAEEVNGMKDLKQINEIGQEMPNVEVGDIVDIEDVWDGTGEEPTESWSYWIREDEWLNYSFKKVGDHIIITKIELL